MIEIMEGQWMIGLIGETMDGGRTMDERDSGSWEGQWIMGGTMDNGRDSGSCEGPVDDEKNSG